MQFGVCLFARGDVPVDFEHGQRIALLIALQGPAAGQHDLRAPGGSSGAVLLPTRRLPSPWLRLLRAVPGTPCAAVGALPGPAPPLPSTRTRSPLRGSRTESGRAGPAR